MAKTVVCLYDAPDEARQVEQDLEQAGFGTDHLEIVSHEGGSDRYRADASTYAPDTLVGYGVPQDEAETYAEAVRRGGTLVVARVHDEDAQRAVDIMARHNPVDFETRRQEFQASGFTGYDRNAEPFSGAQRLSERERTGSMRRDTLSTGTNAANTNDEATARVVREDLHVGKREVQRGGARLHTYVVERPVEETLRLREEHVTVDRQTVDRPATEADLADAFQERTFELTETSEEAVVQKEARVVEEISLRKDVETREETVRDTVRETKVDVDQLGADRSGTGRADDGTTFARTALQDDRYRGRTFSDIEPELRQEYEKGRPGGVWEEIKEGVRSTFDRDRDGHPG